MNNTAAAAVLKTVFALTLGSLLGAMAAAQGATGAQQPAAQYASSWDEYLALKDQAHGGTKMTWAKLPDWTGVWTRRASDGLRFDPLQHSMAETTAVLTPVYKAMHEKKVADFKKGIEWDQLSLCLPAGYPRWLTEPFLREFVVRPEETWLINEQLEEIRRIYTDGRGHIDPADAYPLWEGDSVGFWNGDTLVIHTNNLKKGQYNRQQPDYSDKVSTVEQWRKIKPNLIQVTVDVYDPESLAKPWHVVMGFERVTTPDLRIAYWSCEENNNVIKTPDGSTQFVLPGEKGYKDPNSLQDSISNGAIPDGKK